MELTVYHLKNCDSCKKAIRELQAAGHDLTLFDVRADGIPASELARIETQVGFETLLNTRSTTWRGLSDAEKTGVNADKALKLMADHPTLIKRPVIVCGDEITVGWTPEVRKNYL